MKIAVILIHNKTDAENIAQIELIKPFLQEVVDGPFTDPDTGETWTTIHHEIEGLNIPHEVKIHQIVPFGVTAPPNRHDVNSGGIVYYGAGDEDKVGNHPRFFNWGLKRGTDYGADIVVYLDLPAEFTATRARQSLQKFANNTEFIEASFGKLASVRLLKQVGQLKEDRNLTEAITDLKTRVVEKGLKNG